MKNTVLLLLVLFGGKSCCSDIPRLVDEKGQPMQWNQGADEFGSYDGPVARVSVKRKGAIDLFSQIAVIKGYFQKFACAVKQFHKNERGWTDEDRKATESLWLYSMNAQSALNKEQQEMQDDIRVLEQALNPGFTVNRFSKKFHQDRVELAQQFVLVCEHFNRYCFPLLGDNRGYIFKQFDGALHTLSQMHKRELLTK